MKLNITKTNLQKALNAVSKAVSTKPTLEILKNIALNASKGVLRVSATDLELSISTYVGVDIVEEGATTVSAKTFTEFVSLLPEGNITLYLSNNELRIEAENVKSKFSTIPYEEFPTLPTVNEDASLLFKISRDRFKYAIEKTTFAADRGIRQPVFSGILFENEENKINMVATDGFRLSKYSIEVSEENSPKDIKPVVPYVSLDNLSRLSDDSEDEFVEAYMVSKNNQMLFKTGRTEISTSLLDGDFPNYRAILPEKTINSYKLKLSELVDRVKLSNVFARQEDALRIWIKKTNGSGNLVLQSRVPEVGEYESQVDAAVSFEEEDLEISFNTRKLLDILSRVGTDGVVFDIVVKPRTEHRMLIVKEDGNDDFIHLLTPLVGA